MHGDSAAARERLRVGTSGYDYEHWKGHFYPSDLPKTKWLEFYASHFDTVEINATFYGLPEPHTFDHWRELAPAGFLYALKFSRYGSHLKHLKDPEETVALFVERAERLRDALGPILVQLPPRWKANPDRLAPGPPRTARRLSGLWASVLMTTGSPSSRARDTWRSLRSSRSGLALSSTATRCSLAACSTLMWTCSTR